MSKKSDKTGTYSSRPPWETGPFTTALTAVFGASGAEWAKTLVFALAVAFVIRWAFIEPFRIPSGSMETTLHGDPRFGRGDRVFVNKLVYGLRVPFMNKRIWHGKQPQRWDIVVFRTVEANSDARVLIKRVVGLPGEYIHVGKDGKVYANGQPLTLPPNMVPVSYTQDGQFGVIDNDAFAKVPEGHYLVMGDNSAHSRDGRYWGFLPNENILGRAFCIWWPVTRWHDFTGFSHTWWWRTLVGALALTILTRVFVGQLWRVPRHCTSDSLAQHDLVWLNRVALGASVPFTQKRIGPRRAPKRGALVTYWVPGKDGRREELRVGRVAGFAGEDISLSNGKLLVNGCSPADSPSLTSLTWDGGEGQLGKQKSKQNGPTPDSAYFVIGDGPNAGPDSRTLGWISHDQLIGVISRVCWPLRRWKRIRA